MQMKFRIWSTVSLEAHNGLIDQWHTVSIREEINMKNQKIEQKKAGEKLHRYWSPYTAGNANNYIRLYKSYRCTSYIYRAQLA